MRIIDSVLAKISQLTGRGSTRAYQPANIEIVPQFFTTPPDVPIAKNDRFVLLDPQEAARLVG